MSSPFQEICTCTLLMLFITSCDMGNKSDSFPMISEKESFLVRSGSEIESDIKIENLVSFRKSKTNYSLTNGYRLPYDLDSINFSCSLPKELLEISALSYVQESSKLVCVNDEEAIIYLIDIENCEVTHKYNFGKKGDYEGIEIVDDVIYVLKANGNIYPFNLVKKEALTPIKTKLSTVNDVEGLGFDYVNKELLLICKGSPNLNKHQKLKNSKSVFSYSLEDNKLLESPKFIIRDNDLLEHLDGESDYSDLSRSQSKKYNQRIKSFSPSAIAKHPIDGHFYVLSSVGKSLVVCDVSGNILDIVFLNPNIFIQPEGIAFNPNGQLYISNEGKSLVAKIFTFDFLLDELD